MCPHCAGYGYVPNTGQDGVMAAKNISTESNPRPMTEQDYLEVKICNQKLFYGSNYV
jgi:hypothetical protein